MKMMKIYLLFLALIIVSTLAEAAEEHEEEGATISDDRIDRIDEVNLRIDNLEHCLKAFAYEHDDTHRFQKLRFCLYHGWMAMP